MDLGMCITPHYDPLGGREEYGSIHQARTSYALVHYCMLIGTA